MTIKFLTEYAALYTSDTKSLVVSDLHIGLETELIRSGIRIHKQIEKFKDILDKLIELTKAKNLIILGDVKHKVPGTSMQELRDIPRFLEYLSTKVKVFIAKGNHDDFLEALVPSGVKIYGSRGFRIGKYGFFHGHAWPSEKLMQCDYLFMGHIQSAVEFKDKFGYSSIQQVWLKGRLNQMLIKKKYDIDNIGKLNIIIVPSFNRLSGRLSVNMTLEEELIGPLLTSKILDLDETKTYLLDGTYLGLLKNVRKNS